MHLPTDLPVTSSPRARALFLAAAAITVAVMLGATSLGANHRLTSIYYTLFARLDYWGAIALLLILIASVFIPTRWPTASLLQWIGDHPLSMAVGTALVLSAGSLFVYQNHPLAMDEYTQFLQSQVFAAGHVTGHFPVPLLNWLIPEGFQDRFLVHSWQTGAVVSGYCPSFALLLTPFTFLGIPWACNPVISGLTVLVIHRLALRMFEARAAAGLAVLLTIASPVVFANGISYYSMPAHLLANSLFALLLTSPAPRRALLAGLVGSVALTLHNPVPHLLFALPWLVWVATRPRGILLLGCMAVGYAPLCLLLGLGWFWLTTSLRTAGVQASAVASSAVVQADRIAHVFALPDDTLLLARLIGLAKIWVWAVPGLVLLAAAGVRASWDNVFCRLMLCSALTTLAGFLFVPVDQGHGWGFRYFHSAWVVLPLLAVPAIRDDYTRTFTVGCAVLTLTFGVGVRAWQMHDFIADNLSQVPAYAGTEPRVILIDPTLSYYGADLVQNDPWLRGGVVRMITRGSKNDEAMMREYFPRMHRVYADLHGAVWSAAPVSLPARRREASQGPPWK